MKILVTGGAGFIGFHLINKLAGKGHQIVGLDNINDYYDVNLKYGRLNQLGIDHTQLQEGEIHQSTSMPDVRLIKMDLQDRSGIMNLFEQEKFDVVVNLAAQAGVRYSLVNPHAYIDSNIVGFLNILEACRHNPVKHLVYASSSSVYGLNQQVPFSTHHHTDHAISLYAASKKSNELMAHTYSHLYGIPTTGLRFFTVYGPWGRPDMALFIFTKAILNDEPFEVYNHGNMSRDFTYVDDIVESINRLIPQAPSRDEHYDHTHPDSAASSAPYRVFNIGNNKPVSLMEFISAIEEKIGREGKKIFQDIQPGDVQTTFADVQELFDLVNFRPDTPVTEGISRFVDWYRDFYQL